MGTATAIDNNSVLLEGDIIVYRQAGDQTYDSVIKVVSAIQMLAADLDGVKILVDYTDMGKVDMGARRAGLYAIKNLRFDKVAIYGASPYFTRLINVMAKAVGKSDRLHFAQTRAEALDWLK